MKKWGAAGLALQLSWTLLFSLLIPLLAGIWADKRFGTWPWGVLIGMIVGILAATLGVARMVLRMFPKAKLQNTDHSTTDAVDEEEQE